MNKILTEPFDELTFCQELVKEALEAKSADKLNKIVEGYAATLEDWKDYCVDTQGQV